MFYINGHTKTEHFENKSIKTLPELIKLVTKILDKGASSDQTWYEVFLSPDDGEYWYFSNQKIGYAISIKYFDKEN